MRNFALGDSCRAVLLSPRTFKAWRCPYGSVEEQYQVYPVVDPETGKVAKAGLVHWVGPRSFPSLRTEDCR